MASGSATTVSGALSTNLWLTLAAISTRRAPKPAYLFSGLSRESAPADQAASLVIVDDQPDLHVLMGRRLTTLRFAPGMIVFPGGAVEAEDFDAQQTRTMVNVDVPGMERDDAAANIYAALRETHEEAGVWVGGDGPIDAHQFPVRRALDHARELATAFRYTILSRSLPRW